MGSKKKRIVRYIEVRPQQFKNTPYMYISKKNTYTIFKCNIK